MPNNPTKSSLKIKRSIFQRVLQSDTFLSLLLIKIRGSSLVIKFIFTLFVAKYLGLEELGFFGLVTAATIVIPMLMSLGLGYVLCRRAVTSSVEDLVIDLRYYGWFTLYSYIIPFAACFYFGVREGNILLWLSVIAIVLTEHLNTTSYQLLQNLSRPLAANVLHFIRSTIWAIAYMCIALFLPGSRNIELLMIFWLLGSAFSLGCFFWLVRSWPWLF